MNSYLIWIPSLQDYRRFGELTTLHQRRLSKLDEEDLEFLFQLNLIIEELCVDTVDLDKLTIIDKYIICAYLRMRCIDTALKLTMTCPKCGVDFTGTIDINDVIDSNVEVLDRNYNRTILVGDYQFDCGLPLMGTEYDLLKTITDRNINKTSPENMYSFHTMAHIKAMTIRGKSINFQECPIETTTLVLSQLPLKTIQKIQLEFVNPIAKMLNPSLLDVPCPTGTCPPFQLSLDLTNLNDIIKLMFQESPVEILREIYYLSKEGVDANYVDTLTPKERSTMIKFIMEDRKQQRAAADTADDGKAMVGASHGFDQFDDLAP